jgi:hypothetical protein
MMKRLETRRVIEISLIACGFAMACAVMVSAIT